tara:strand:+ start:111 stop:311 length:201 start_codon:yes stop_codon:yes gene_type:complete
MSEIKSKGGAPLGNKNGQRGPTAATASLALRCTPDLRAQVVASAGRDGVSLSEWLVSAANLALECE